MRTFVISYILIFFTSYSIAQQLPFEPHYRLSYMEALLEEIRTLPEEERFLYLSYISTVGSDYRRVVEEMIVAKGVLQRMKSEGITQANEAHQQKIEKLEHYKQILRRNTARILSYYELEIKIGRQALEEISSKQIPEILRWDYYKAITFRIELEEIKKMPEEEMFLYLRDNFKVDRSFHLLIEDLGRCKKNLAELRASGVDEEDEHYRLAKEGLESVTAAIRLEAGRVLKGYTFHAMILDRSWRKAAEQLIEQDQETFPEI